MRLPWRLAAAGLLLAVSLAAQKKDRPVYRVDVKLVRLLATVKDPAGNPVGTLDKDDFTVYDNGVEQEIALFERRTAQPLSVALLVDTSASTAVKLKEGTASVMRFLRALLREGNPADRVMLYSFNNDVILEAGLTRRLERIGKKLKRLKGQSGTSLYDALFFASRALQRRPGRRVIIAVSDGADTTSVKSYQDALRMAHAADAVIYGVMIAPVTNDPGRHVAGENALAGLCRATGGRVLAAALGEGLDEAFDSILRDLRTQYLIGYYPRNIPYSTEPFHRIEVRLRRDDLRVITRTGYYGEYKDPKPREASSTGPALKPRQQE